LGYFPEGGNAAHYAFSSYHLEPPPHHVIMHLKFGEDSYGRTAEARIIQANLRYGSMENVTSFS
jgi:hypothetical protein